MGTQYCTGDLPDVWRPNGAKTPNHFNIENCGDRQCTGQYKNYDKYCEALLHPKLHNVESPADRVKLSYVTIPFSDEHKSQMTGLRWYVF